jgi:hypothetical protein
MEHRLEVMPEDWQRILAVVAHPDDLEYGAASAVARWTSAGKWVGNADDHSGTAGPARRAPRIRPGARPHDGDTTTPLRSSPIDNRGHHDVHAETIGEGTSGRRRCRPVSVERFDVG